MITVREIQTAVARNFRVDEGEFFSQCRYHDVARPRQIAMMLSRELTHHSLPRIGHFFHRDHSTILHGIRSAKRRVSADPELAARVEQIRWVLRANYVKKDAIAQCLLKAFAV